MVKSRPLVTVYVVNHNYGRYLSQAVESLQSQTLQDFEILIIDDGSTDNSREVIELYRDNERVTIIYQQNKGLTVTNNIALRAARGRYIMRLDADDYLDSHALAILSGVLDANPQVGLVFPDYFLVDESGHVTDMIRRHDFDEVQLMDQPAHGACTMIRRELLEEIGGYDESFRCQDGYDLWLRFTERYPVKNVSLPLFYYRQHGTSLTRNETRILDTRAQILRKQALRKGRAFRTVAVVPVRGQKVDSRSFALETLGDRALIDWTIDCALDSERIEAVIVTTPDSHIIEHVEQRYGERVFTLRRDPSLARINSFTREALLDAVQRFSAERFPVDVAAELFVEFPFRRAHFIDSAVDLMEIFSTDRVVSVRPDVSNLYSHDGSGLVPLRGSRRLRLEGEEIYRDVGSINLSRVTALESDAIYDGARIGHVVVDEFTSFCLRSDWDWEIAQYEATRCAAATQDNTNRADNPAAQGAHA